MVKKRINKERNARFMSLISPQSLTFNTAEDEQNNQPYTESETTSKNSRVSASPLTAISSTSDLGRPPLTQNNQAPNNGTNTGTSVTVRNPLPLLGNNNFDFNKLTGELLDTNNAPTYVTDLSNAPNIEGQAQRSNPLTYDTSPEGKLLGTLAQTNPQPRSIWKRLLAGLTEGASQVTPNDTIGSAVGKLIGGTAAGAVPQVDSANQYKQNRARAIDQYKVEKEAQSQQELQQTRDLQQRKLQQEIDNANEKLKRDQAQQKILNDARVRGEKRAQVKQQLDALEKFPENSIERYQAVKELKDQGVTVPLNYGIRPQTERTTTAIDQETGNTIRVKQDGTPILDKAGNKVITKMAGESKENATQKRAEAEAQEPPVMKGAAQSQALNEYRQQNPKAASKTDAQLLADAQSRPWITARVDAIMQEATATRRQNVNKRLSNKPAAQKSNSKVQPSNKAATTDFTKYFR